jgi:hypothetical protein
MASLGSHSWPATVAANVCGMYGSGGLHALLQDDNPAMNLAGL